MRGLVQFPAFLDVTEEAQNMRRWLRVARSAFFKRLAVLEKAALIREARRECRTRLDNGLHHEPSAGPIKEPIASNSLSDLLAQWEQDRKQRQAEGAERGREAVAEVPEPNASPPSEPCSPPMLFPEEAAPRLPVYVPEILPGMAAPEEKIPQSMLPREMWREP
jgi:hypothetical protein